MKLKRTLLLLILALTVALPAQASTWRSNATGNVFSFYNDGSMGMRGTTGAYSVGRWWWTSVPREFAFQVDGYYFTVEIMSSGATCKPNGQGRGTWWTMISARGAEEKKVEGPGMGWFQEFPTPTGGK